MDKDSIIIGVEIPIKKIRTAALDAFTSGDLESFDFLRRFFYDLYDKDRTSRADFQDRVIALLVSAIDERDDFIFNYGGNPSYQWRKIKYPEKEKEKK